MFTDLIARHENGNLITHKTNMFFFFFSYSNYKKVAGGNDHSGYSSGRDHSSTCSLKIKESHNLT